MYNFEKHYKSFNPHNPRNIKKPNEIDSRASFLSYKIL